MKDTDHSARAETDESIIGKQVYLTEDDGREVYGVVVRCKGRRAEIEWDEGYPTSSASLDRGLMVAS